MCDMVQHIRHSWQQRGRWCVQRMESAEESFSAFLSERFPPNVKQSTSGVFLAEFGCQVIQVL